MATITRRVPSQRVRFDPFRTLKKVHWKSKTGTWCSCGIFLNNLGEGGSSTVAIHTIKPGLEDFVINLGTNGDGNGAFWNVRADGPIVSPSHFAQTVELSDHSFMQAYGVREFDAGDSHNGSEFFFLAPKDAIFEVSVSATSTVATPPYAKVWGDPFTPSVQNAVSNASGIGFADATFRFNLVTKTVVRL